MAKKQYNSPMAKVKRFTCEDVLTGSGETELEGVKLKYGSFDSSWISTADE